MKFHFNGWQRIWIVASLLSLALVTFFIYDTYRSPSFVDDPFILAQLNNDELIDVDIPGLGIVKFPNDMPEKEIEVLVHQNFDKNLNTIPVLAKSKIQERNMQQAAEARKENDIVRQSNRELLLFGYAGWLTFVFLIYIAGWCVGWIYRGFKAT